MALNKVLYAKHPRFDSAAYAPLSVLCNSLIEVYPKAGNNDATWTPEDGLVSSTAAPLWRGWAAVTPNKDWRARDRRWAYDDTAVHAYRVQLWHVRKNLLVPKEAWSTAPLVRFKEGQVVKVTRNDSDPTYEGLRLVVRNAITDSDKWQPTLLCDMSTEDPLGSKS